MELSRQNDRYEERIKYMKTQISELKKAMMSYKNNRTILVATNLSHLRKFQENVRGSLTPTATQENTILNWKHENVFTKRRIWGRSRTA